MDSTAFVAQAGARVTAPFWFAPALVEGAELVAVGELRSADVGREVAGGR